MIYCYSLFLFTIDDLVLLLRTVSVTVAMRLFLMVYFCSYEILYAIFLNEMKWCDLIEFTITQWIQWNKIFDHFPFHCLY